MSDDPFDARLAEWEAWADSPWGRIRFAVVAATLAREVAALGGAPLRVLDVGGGDGRDAVPLAVAGHDVTVVDSAPQWRDAARSRAAAARVPDRVHAVEGSIDDLGGFHGFDLVLCHFLLQYRPDAAADLSRLAGTLRPGGRLSLIAPNPVGRVLMRLTREGPEAALEELERDDYVTHTFATTVRRLLAAEVTALLPQAGLREVGRYGGRIANDLITDDRAKQDPAYFSRLETLELALCDREPYRDIGGFWQVVAERTAH